MTHEEIQKEFANKVINAYNVKLELLKKQKKITKEEEALEVWRIFWLKRGYNLRDVNAIKVIINENKDIYKAQTDMYKCGEIEWLSIIRWIIEHHKELYDELTLLVKYVNMM